MHKILSSQVIGLSEPCKNGCADSPNVVPVVRKHFVERVAYQKGYRVSACGTIVSSPKGITRKLRPDDSGYLTFSVTVPMQDGKRKSTSRELKAIYE